MDEQNFDKILKQRMAEERDFPFSDEKWDKMEQKLEDFTAQKRYYRLLWAMALPFVGLLGLLFFVVGQLQDTKRTLLDLKQEVQQLQTEKTDTSIGKNTFQKGSVIEKDTVYQHIIIKRYDTIFQTVVQRSLSEAQLLNENKNVITSQKGITELKTNISTASEAIKKENPIKQSNKNIQDKDIALQTAIPNKTAIGTVSNNPISILGKDSMGIATVLKEKLYGTYSAKSFNGE